MSRTQRRRPGLWLLLFRALMSRCPQCGGFASIASEEAGLCVCVDCACRAREEGAETEEMEAAR